MIPRYLSTGTRIAGRASKIEQYQRRLVALLVEAGINNKEKYGRDLRGSREHVFDGGVFWKKLGG
jgi:hypothetical protein